MRSGHGDWIKRAGEAVPESYLKLYGSLLGPVLWSRGFHSTDEADHFLNPKLDQISSPFLLKNMEAASEHLTSALINNEKIAVYADYDMDGMSGLALLIAFFKSIGCENTVYYLSLIHI